MNDLKLSDDPREALSELASYIRTVRKDPSRRYYDGEEFVGYWQTPEWVEGLLSLYHEAGRVAALQSSESTTPNDLALSRKAGILE
jgi:hypothetical protein